jgi:hypothetical protein
MTIKYYTKSIGGVIKNIWIKRVEGINTLFSFYKVTEDFDPIKDTLDIKDLVEISENEFQLIFSEKVDFNGALDEVLASINYN